MPESQPGFFEIDLRPAKPKPAQKLVDTPVVVAPTLTAPVYEEKVVTRPKPQRAAGNEIAVWLMNADVLIRNDEKSLAAHLIRKVLAKDSFHPEALKRLLKITDSSDFVSREKILNALIKVESNFENLVELGHCYYHQNQDQKAADVYHQALTIVTEAHEQLFDVHKNLGNLACKVGDFDAAEESFHKAYELSSQSDVLHVNLGTLAIQKNDFNEALEKFRRALELNPENDKAWVGLAMAHNQMGDFVLAMANLENALEINPSNRTAVHIISQWCLRDQKMETAIPYLEQFLANVECDEEMSLVLIHFFCLKNCWTQALLEVERVLLWKPASVALQKVEKEIRVAIESA